ncbi:hypothetical protein ACJ2_11920 [Pantoea sp. QMID2]|nr:hypothetical protein ACJ1_19810 [Pantoea sp. QMID1]GME38083.1 hypothetical protein ACJ3_20240 [Pantoea sp. QMID3]GME53168.1 hypothetical protein ACJ4_12230 [Pantoea sp. QMID4]GME54179.1 hypothetical protein ACJ2_11920 [Pantoea sp. QMID2]
MMPHKLALHVSGKLYNPSERLSASGVDRESEDSVLKAEFLCRKFGFSFGLAENIDS